MPSRRSRDLTHLSGRYQYGEWGLIPHSPKRVLMRCKFRAVTSHWRQFFSCEMKFWWILRALVTDQSKKEKNQRSGRLESNAVQSSRSKSSPRTGHVLRFQWNSVVTSDGGAPCTKAWKQCLAWFWIDHYQIGMGTSHSWRFGWTLLACVQSKKAKRLQFVYLLQIFGLGALEKYSKIHWVGEYNPWTF